MVDPYNRIQEHLGTALRKLSLFETRVAAGSDTSRDAARCLTDMQLVAEELDQAFDALKRERLRLADVAAAAGATMRRAQRLFAQSPNPCLVLRRESAAIDEANAAASRLLNVSSRHLIGKAFTNFLQQDREAFLRQLQRGADGAAEYWDITLRPRERAIVRVRVNAIADNDHTAAIVLSQAVMDGDAPEYAAS
jgi:PAS domain-containing protein